MEEMDEEHGGEDGLLAEAKTDKGKLTAKSVKDRFKEIKGGKDAADERKALDAYLALIEQEASAGKRVKDALKAFNTKVTAKYGQLSEVEIKTMVVEDKWLAALAASVQGELDRVSQALAGRIKQLAERYATPLSAVARSNPAEGETATVIAAYKKAGHEVLEVNGIVKGDTGVMYFARKEIPADIRELRSLSLDFTESGTRKSVARDLKEAIDFKLVP
jgi:hypothetical protein